MLHNIHQRIKKISRHCHILKVLFVIFNADAQMYLQEYEKTLDCRAAQYSKVVDFYVCFILFFLHQTQHHSPFHQSTQSHSYLGGKGQTLLVHQSYEKSWIDPVETNGNAIYQCYQCYHLILQRKDKLFPVKVRDFQFISCYTITTRIQSTVISKTI